MAKFRFISPRQNGKKDLLCLFAQNSQTKHNKTHVTAVNISGTPKAQLAANPGRLMEGFDDAD
jgi:hypothetical protein